MVGRTVASSGPGRVFMLCNEAIARAALDSGVGVYAGYPGSPTVEILESMMEAAPEAGMAAELSSNEKVALETAAAASMAGVRSLVSMKSVGLNVASDTFFSLAYTGVRGGMVLAVADDPHAHSSQSEQDGRLYAPAAEVPMLEPSDPAEAMEYVREAYAVSEEFGVPVILRTVTRVNHQSGIVELGRFEPRPLARVAWPHPPARFVTVAASARAFHIAALERTASIRMRFEGSGLNRLIDRGSRIGILTAGAGFNYAQEALQMLGADLSILKLGTVWPVPEDLVGRFLAGLDTLVVVEELSPFLEERAEIVARRARPGLVIAGKKSGHFAASLEYNAEIVADVLAAIIGKKPPVDFAGVRSRAEALKEGLPSRPPTFCPGCPHRASLGILRAALRGVKHVVSSDIGCYSMAPLEPLVWGDSVLAMGASLGVANGLSKVLEEKVVAIIGDSTFFHAGLPGLVNAAWRNAEFKLVILDNGVTAMTGQQLHPGTPQDEQPGGMRRIAPEDVVRAVGVEQVLIVDPYERESALPAVKEALGLPGFGVIVFRRECALHADRNRRRRGERIPVSVVSEEKCRNFHTCIRDFFCPAISVDGQGRAVISPELCDGCLACAKLCANQAIFHAGEV
jgi:indolepyruvate ferredoxin oxidoreductase, alpha subunit